MQQRCDNPNNDAYRHYGGRGIKVCERWRKFENFLADMGERPDKTSLDRIDTNGNYEPSNCRWATRKQQMGNTRQANLVTYRGETMCVTHLAERLNLCPFTLKGRIDRGWPEERWSDTPKPMGPRYSKHCDTPASA
jgi:hypothetical protein